MIATDAPAGRLLLHQRAWTQHPVGTINRRDLLGHQHHSGVGSENAPALQRVDSVANFRVNATIAVAVPATGRRQSSRAVGPEAREAAGSGPQRRFQTQR